MRARIVNFFEQNRSHAIRCQYNAYNRGEFGMTESVGGLNYGYCKGKKRCSIRTPFIKNVFLHVYIALSIATMVIQVIQA